MNRNRFFSAFAILLTASIAFRGGTTATRTAAPGSSASPEVTEPTASVSTTTEFALPEDVSNLTDSGGVINFQTSMSIADAITFYRAEFTESNYTERDVNTFLTDTTFSMVFDGHTSRKAIIIQGTDLGDQITNISIRLEDI